MELNEKENCTDNGRRNKASGRASLAPERFMRNLARAKKMLSSSMCNIPLISALNFNGILKRFFAFSLA
jgi:hypothetical protein